MKLAKTLTLVLMLALTSLGVCGQNQPATSPNVFFVRIDNLDVDNYARLHHAIKADGHFNLDLACVPAHILTVRALGTNSNDVQKFLADFQKVADQAGLSKAVLLSDFDPTKFYEACSAMRH